MTPLQNQAITARPNVIRNQTIPNTLDGVSDPSPFLPRRAPSIASIAVAVVFSAVALSTLLLIATRLG